MQPFENVVTWGHMINDKHLHYLNAYGHQSWQGGYIQWGACFYRVTRHFHEVVLQGQLTN